MMFAKSEELAIDGLGAWLATVGAATGTGGGEVARIGIREAALASTIPSLNRGFDAPSLADPRSPITTPTQDVGAWIGYVLGSVLLSKTRAGAQLSFSLPIRISVR